jgi:putative molybdopterin biosynthesis protein
MADWQEQFLQVVDRDEAQRRFRSALNLQPRGEEWIALNEALGRILSQDITAPLDVPGFDRANVDGFAVRAADTFGAEETQPVRLRWTGEVILPGRKPEQMVTPGTASVIATGAMLPRGADAVVMVEFTTWEPDPRPADSTTPPGGTVLVKRPVTPGSNVTMAGTDIGQGEVVLRRGELLTARETAVLAALGLARVPVFRKPRVAIFSTGDELVPPGQPLGPGQIYDSNATMLADAVRENGGEPTLFGIVADNAEVLRSALQRALSWDMVLLSGGTSKGAGDLCYRVVSELGKPGILVHGVSLKPGKPLCLAVIDRTPVVILPGFPTSALFTFREFVAPVIRLWAGLPEQEPATLPARLPVRLHSERGRTEYVLVNLVEWLPPSGDVVRAGSADSGQPPSAEATAGAQTGTRPATISNPRSKDVASGPISPAIPDATMQSVSDAASSSPVRYAAYPLGKGSGSVTAFSRADGFVIIPKGCEMLEAGEIVTVHLMGRQLRPADLVVIGSHCVGLDYLLSQLHARGFRTKMLAVGSLAGLTAARRGECDLAGIHLFDPASGEYNRPFVTGDLYLLPGYGRLQGIAYRPGDPRFEGKSAAEAVRAALADPECLLVNRNAGSGTRILIDRLLQGARPPGYANEARSHHAVAAAIAQGRADWGVCIGHVAQDHGLAFIPLQQEWFDFVVPRQRWSRPAVVAFRQLLADPAIRQALQAFGFTFERPADVHAEAGFINCGGRRDCQEGGS